MTRHSSHIDKMNLPTFIFYSWLKTQGKDDLAVVLRTFGRSQDLPRKLRELAQYEAKDVLERLEVADIDYDAIARKIQLRLEYDTPESWEVANDFNDELVTIGDNNDPD